MVYVQFIQIQTLYLLPLIIRFNRCLRLRTGIAPNFLLLGVKFRSIFKTELSLNSVCLQYYMSTVKITHICLICGSLDIIGTHTHSEYAISQLRIVRSGLHLVTNLHVGNFCDKSTETTLHEICVQVFLRFSDSSKPSLSLSLIYELVWLAGIGKSVKNLLKSSCMIAPLTKVAHIF